MGRRIFNEKNYNVTKHVLPYDEFKLFSDTKQGFTINEENKDKIIDKANKLLDKEYPVLPASEYMMFVRNGNRTVYQNKRGPRRDDVLLLSIAEYLENKGRFTDKIINLVWMLLEETTWVIPAHNKGVCLPYTFKEKETYIDLFSASTGATLSVVYTLCKDKFDEVTPLINERLLYEINRRITKPFLDNVIMRTQLQWSGVRGGRPNNWNPWITSNVLTVCALTEKDLSVRESVVQLSLTVLDNFIKGYKTDGGCDEGPGYWNAAGGAFFDCLNLLYDLTGGYIDLFDDELIKRMGEYEVKACITGRRFLNFADCGAKLNPNSYLLYDYGVRCKSEMLRTYALSLRNGELPMPGVDHNHVYRYLRALSALKEPYEEFVAPTNFYLDGIIIAGSRESSCTEKGLYLALKGGCNAESHNHNDVGTMIVFADGQPIFLDAGSGTYTKKTFSAQRYDIWAMCSEYHNLPTINGVNQVKGEQAHSSEHVYDEKTGKLQMSLKTAFPEEANIKTYTRSGVLENACITIEDNIELNDKGEIIFNYICNTAPENITENSFVIHGRTITFDSDLKLEYETVDCTEPEVERIPKAWDTDAIYRIRLKTKNKTIGKNYIMTIR